MLHISRLYILKSALHTQDMEKENLEFKSLKMAVYLLYASVFAGILRTALNWNSIVEKVQAGLTPLNVSPTVGIIFVILVQAFSMGLILLLIFFISKKKNWARIIYLILLIVGTPLSVLPLITALASNPIDSLIGIAQIAVQAIAMVIVFINPVAQEFSQSEQSKTPESAEPPETPKI